MKLWVACRYLHYQPEDLWMVICTFSPDCNGHIQKIRSCKKDYRAIEQELKSLLTADTSKVSLNETNKYHSLIANIHEIEEIPL